MDNIGIAYISLKKSISDIINRNKRRISSAPLHRVLMFAAAIHHCKAVDEIEKDAKEGGGGGWRDGRVGGVTEKATFDRNVTNYIRAVRL